MSTTKNGHGRKAKGNQVEAQGDASEWTDLVPPSIAKRMNGELPHPATTGNSTPAGIASHDPSAAGFSDEPRKLERNFGGKTLSRVPLDMLVRHPKNRHPTEAAVAKMAASIEKEGLLDPLVVRMFGLAHWQIISGETRYLALKKLGRTGEVEAHVVRCDDARALELLAIYNAERTDLNAIEKARMIEELCKPIDEEGGGLTREQAAKIYGLETGAAASNLVGLLKLPKVWQERIISDEFPQTFARLLIPYAHSPRLMEAIEEDYQEAKKQGWRNGDYETRDQAEESIDNIVAEHIRPVDAKVKCELPFEAVRNIKGVDTWALRKATPRLFELTTELEEQLDIVELTIDKKAGRYATNWKLWDSLQIPLLKAKLAKGKKAAVGVSGDDDDDARPAKKKPPTPAELKAKAKEQERILAQRIERWRHRWLRQLCAAEIDRQRFMEWQVLKVILWLAGQPSWMTHADESELALGKTLCQALNHKSRGLHEGCKSETWAALHAKCQARAGYNDHKADLGSVAKQLVLKLLKTDDRSPGQYLVPPDLVEGLAADLSIDLAGAWRLLQTCEDRTELETFFELHNGEQLEALAGELGTTVKGSKADKVRMLMAMPLGGRTFPLPKAIKPIVEASAAGGKKKKGAK